MSDHVRRALARANPVVFTTVAGLAGFCAYFAMYAFRKPFTAATFEHTPGWPFALNYKIALILAQVAGYALSKFIGVKVISEIHPRHRASAIIGLIGLSWLALVAFAAIPAPWNVLALFVNGLPLGMIWGLVFGFMEGRRVSEVLASMMCASFILSSGVVKSVGTWLMQAWHVSPFWMPAATGLLFMPLLLASVWVLSLLPPPSPRDEAERTRRLPMTGAQRGAFLKAYAPGLIAIVFGYILLTAFRDFRDNFAAEIWTALGRGGEAGIFSASELPVAVITLLCMAAVIAIRDNRRALVVIHAMVAGGFALLGLSTLAFQAHLISPLVWMILAGTGLYAAYNPINAVLFDRLVAASGRVANAGFLIYVADSCGYLGSVALLLWRNFGQASLNWLQFFTLGAYVTSLAGGAATVLAAVYFYRRSADRAARDRDGAAPWPRPLRRATLEAKDDRLLSETLTPSLPRLLDGGAALEVRLEGEPRRFHALWLRDNAQDPATRSPGNGQRLITLLDIPRDTRIAEAAWTEGQLSVRFEPEGRVVSFDPDWLLAQAYDKPAPPAAGWTGEDITRWDTGLAQPVEVFAAVRDDPVVRLRWLEAVRRYGFARLTGAPAAPGVAFDVAHLFGYVRETNYGRAFDVRVMTNPNNLAYTNLGLQAHTDNPYRDPAPGLQILACIENTVEGGESLVIDGFKAAEQLQAESPRGFELLTRYCARFEYSGSEGVRLRSKRPIIELGPDGELRAVRFNNRSAAPFTDIPYDDMADYYAAYRRMAKLIEDPALAVTFQLQPGDLFIVDNLRVLHARTAITSSGERWLEGCYADKDGLLSTLAALEADTALLR